MLAVFLGLAVGMGCNYTPGTSSYPHVLAEYETVVRRAEAIAVHAEQRREEESNQEEGGARKRRAVPTSPDRHFPFGSVNIVGSIGRAERTTIYRAAQYASLLYTIPEGDTPIDLDIHVGTSTPEGTSIIGSWNGLYITLHTLSIGSKDLLFVVTLHEIYHVLHFGSTAFEELTTDENVYTGNQTAACVSNRTVYTDDYVDHWKNNKAPFSNDFMEPIIPSSKVKVSRCTATAVVEGRTTWNLMACDTTNHCPANYTCTGSSHSLVGWCLHNDQITTSDVSSRPHPARQFPALSAYVFGVFLFINLITQCARKHPRSPAARIINSTE